MTSTYSVPGMRCGHCVEAITGEVGKVEGVSDVRVDLDAKIVRVVGGELSGRHALLLLGCVSRPRVTLRLKRGTMRESLNR